VHSTANPVKSGSENGRVERVVKEKEFVDEEAE
jgi:hypothetical protein